MGMIKKSITVTDQQDGWIKSQIKSGQFGNESEVLRDLIRDRISREAEIKTIRAALIEGEKSGRSHLSVEDIWAKAEKMHRAQNG